MTTSTKPLAFIIEDDDKLATIFSQAMIMADFKVQTAMDGQKAIAALADLDPAVVILDLHLPGANGDKILTHLRQDSRLQKTVVILTTADSLLDDNLREQSDFVLLKPVSFSQLRDLGIRLRTTFK